MTILFNKFTMKSGMQSRWALLVINTYFHLSMDSALRYKKRTMACGAGGIREFKI